VSGTASPSTSPCASPAQPTRSPSTLTRWRGPG
jgi:hypothetical protein